MFRHPRYLEIPWELHWERRDKKDGGAHHHPLTHAHRDSIGDVVDRGRSNERPYCVGPRGY
jgi:hypothetical protein